MIDTKEQILFSARDLFLEEGLSHFSMRKVAGRVGLSATALYRHYADKDTLLFEVLLRGFHIFADYLSRVDESLEPLACLEATAASYLDFALNEQAYYEVMFMSSEQITGLKRLNEKGATEFHHTFEILQNRVQRAIDAGVLESIDSERSAFAFWAFAHGQISLFFTGRIELAPSTFVDTYHGLMAEYLRGKKGTTGVSD